MHWHGLDIGGANLKLADGRGQALSQFFPLWQRPAELPMALAELCRHVPPGDGLAVTMTGELADCFATKADGVAAIVAASQAAAVGRALRFYAVRGRWLSAAEACAAPLATAASNWHALAKFAGRYLPTGASLLLDVGSTTADIIPLNNGVPTAIGATDPERLLHGELCYTGVMRSPLCAAVQAVPWRGKNCPLAQELFATTWDAYLTLGDLPEEPACTHTANGRAATRAAAHDRLARAICADRTMFSADDARVAAQAVAASQTNNLVNAVRQVCAAQPSLPQTVIISGAGEFLARRVASAALPNAETLSLAALLGPTVSRCAPAHAVAVLAGEELHE